jgi:octaprenyl-diphosphate synthase
MQRGTEAQARTVREAIENGSTDQLDAIAHIVRTTGALDVARNAAAAEAQRAIAALEQLSVNEYSTSLLQLASQLLARRA